MSNDDPYKNNRWNAPLHGSAAFTPGQVQFRKEWGLDPKPPKPVPVDLSGAFQPLTAASNTLASANVGLGRRGGGYKRDPMTPQEMAQLALSILLLPACVYVIVGSLTALPWWAYLAAFVVLLGLSGRSERLCEAMLAFGRAAITLIAIAAFCQVIPLANRAVLGIFLVISAIYTPFAVIAPEGRRVDELLGKFVTYWLVLVWGLVLFMIGCRVAALWGWDSWTLQADAFWLLKILARSIYDAGMDFWYQFDGWAKPPL
jgi:hypothetical protein